jgi:hypothetical protein
LFVSRLDPQIERLQHSRIDGGDNVDRRIQLFLCHSGFPCIRKAAFHSRVAKPHHRHGEPDQHLLALAQAFNRMSFAVERSKVRFLHFHLYCDRV